MADGAGRGVRGWGTNQGARQKAYKELGRGPFRAAERDEHVLQKDLENGAVVVLGRRDLAVQGPAHAAQPCQWREMSAGMREAS